MLKSKNFNYAFRLVEFVNENEIKREQILSVVPHTRNREAEYTLFWWEEESNDLIS